MSYPVFISYASENADIAEVVHSALAEDGIGSWIAPLNIPEGTIWADSIVAALDAARVVVVIFSAFANNSLQVVREVKGAVDRGLHIVNFWIDKSIPSGSMDYFLGVTHWLNASEPPPASHLPRLLRTVRVLLGMEEPGPDWIGIGYTWTGAARTFVSTPPHWTGSEVPLVGDEAALQSLAAAFQKSQSGAAQTVLVLGDPGAGKSRLVQEFLQAHCAPDSYLLLAQASSGEQAVAFSAVIQLVGPPILQRAVPRMPAELMAEIAQLVPDARRALPELPQVPVVDAAVARRRQIRALVSFFCQLCHEHPVIVAIDDLQWADPVTFEFFAELLLRTPEIKRLPLLVLATLRQADEPAPCSELRVSLSRQRADTYTEIRLHPLAPGLFEGIVQQRLGAELAGKLSANLYERTGGNPYYLLETLAAWEETGDLSAARQAADLPLPPSIENVVLSRVRTLPGASQRCLEIASALEGEFDRSLVAAAAELPQDDVDEALRVLVRRGFIRTGGDTFEVNHDLSREVVYRSVADKAELHRKTAQALESLAGTTLRPAEMEELAHHYSMAQMWDKALKYRLQAGQSALSMFDLASAKRHLEAARDIVDTRLRDVESGTRAEVLQGLGDVYQALEEREDAIRAYKGALALAVSGERGTSLPVRPGDPLQPGSNRRAAAELTGRIGRLYSSDQVTEALAWMETGQAWLDPPSDQAERDVLALIETHTASLLFQEGQFERSEAFCRSALERLGAAGNRAVLAQTWNMLGAALDQRGAAHEALEAYRRSIGLWGAIGNAFETARVENNEAVIVGYRVDLKQAYAIYERILRYFRDQLNERRPAAVTLTNLGRIDAIRGDVQLAESRHREALALARELHVDWLEATAQINLAWVLAHAGRLEAAESEGQQVVRLAREQNVSVNLPEAYRLLSVVSLGYGDIETAADYAEQAHALALERGDRMEEASAERLLGQVEGARGNAAVAVEHLQRSVKIWEEIGDRFELAQSRWQLGLAMRDIGEGPAAFALLVAALTTYAQLPAGAVLAGLRAQGPFRIPFAQPATDALAACRKEMMFKAGWVRSAASPQAANGADLVMAGVRAHLGVSETANGAEVNLTLDTV